MEVPFKISGAHEEPRFGLDFGHKNQSPRVENQSSRVDPPRIHRSALAISFQGRIPVSPSIDRSHCAIHNGYTASGVLFACYRHNIFRK
jgi:hypothetical protein